MKRGVAAGVILMTPVLWILCAFGAVDAGVSERGVEAARLAGEGAVLMMDGKGKPLVSHNPDKALVPASTLKIVTAAAALDVLGPDYRFTTVFRLSGEGDLLVSGQGDPYLVSEELQVIAEALAANGLSEVRRILLDNGYFERGLVLHGTNRSLNPYDAYNGALCVNFNTLFVHVDEKGRVRSAEPQTPLTDMARREALRNGVRGKARINLSGSPDQCLLYAGELLKVFLERAGIGVSGGVTPCDVDPSTVPVFHVHHSQWTLEDLLMRVFRYSNNFMANQIFLTLGASRFGPPATAEKSRRVVEQFLQGLGLQSVRVDEGSGLSRRTRISARQMLRVLEAFRPHRHLLECRDGVCAKTGTLFDVKSLAGYLMTASGDPLPFVILLNGEKVGHGSRDRILRLLLDCVPAQ